VIFEEAVMPKILAPEYPKALTVDGWNKTKGLIARIKKIKTGVSEELTKAKKEFDKVPWGEKLSIGQYVPEGKRLTEQDCKDILRTYLENIHPTFKKLEETFHTLSAFLKKKGNEFASDKDMKQFSKGLLDMAEVANKFTYRIAWGTVSEDNQKWIRERQEAAAKSDKQKKEAVTRLAELINVALKAAQNAKSSKLDKSSYVAPYWNENLRGIGAQIKLAAPHLDPTVAKQLLVLNKEVANIWSEKGMPKTDEDVPKHIDKDIEMLKKFVEAVK
jgi:hypothetical protein